MGVACALLGQPQSSSTNLPPLPADLRVYPALHTPLVSPILPLSLTSLPPVYQMLPEGSFVVSSCWDSIHNSENKTALFNAWGAMPSVSCIVLTTLPSRCRHDISIAQMRKLRQREAPTEHQSQGRKQELPDSHMLAYCHLPGVAPGARASQLGKANGV